MHENSSAAFAPSMVADALFGYVILPDGEIARIRTNFWASHIGGFIIQSDEGYLPVNTRDFTGRVVIHESDLDAFLGERPVEPRHPLVPSSSSSSSLRSTGRRREFDWDGFLIEAARIIYFEGRPGSQNELIERLLHWYPDAHNGDVAPSPTAA